MEKQKIEFIISCIIDGAYFEYRDNHGILVRCKDCRYYHPDDQIPYCSIVNCRYELKPYDYCSKAVKKDDI